MLKITGNPKACTIMYIERLKLNSKWTTYVTAVVIENCSRLNGKFDTYATVRAVRYFNRIIFPPNSSSLFFFLISVKHKIVFALNFQCISMAIFCRRGHSF